MTETPFLNKYAKNMSVSPKIQNATNVLGIATGRDEQLVNIIQILQHKSKNTPCLVGEAGVGKTAIVEGLAYLINHNQVPKNLQGFDIYELNIGELDNNGQGELGYFNYNLSKIIEECIENSDHIILFIDEFHTIMGASNNMGSGMDGSQLLKPPLARGEMKLIGATTYDEFFDFVEPDRALQRRLDTIQVDEPSDEDTVEILKNSLPSYCSHYGFDPNNIVSDEVLQKMVMLSKRYMTDKFLPDKAFDILDASMSQANFNNQRQVTIDNVATAIYLKTKIPMETIASALNPQIFDLKKTLLKYVKGQDEAVDEIVKAVDMSFVGLNDPHKPKATFLFLGTTGVGKTEMAKAMARGLFHDEENIIRLDMAGFNTDNAIERLIGTKGKRGVLTEEVKRKPYSILLLDEIEKASPLVWDLLLSILDDGEIQDFRGRNINFRNLIIILTSNLAADAIKKRYAWVAGDSSSKEEKQYRYLAFLNRVDRVLKRTFRPELVNRFSNRIVFNILDKKEIIKVSKKYMYDLISDLNRIGYDLTFDYDVVDYLTDMGTDIDNGARPLKRVIEKQVSGFLSEKILMSKASTDNDLKFLKTFSITVKGERPSKRDLYGSRELVFEARKAELTEEEKKMRLEIFSDESVEKMAQSRVERPDVSLEADKRANRAIYAK